MDRIVAKCLNKNPKERYQSFDLLQNMLQRELDIIEAKASETTNDGSKLVDIPTGPAPTDHRTTLLLLGYSLLVLAIVGAVVWLLLRRSDGESVKAKIPVSGQISLALSNDERILPNEEGGMSFIDAKDSDVKRVLTSNVFLKNIDISDKELDKSTFESMAKRRTIEALICTDVPINDSNLQNIAIVKSLKIVQIGHTGEFNPQALKYLNELPQLQEIAINNVALTEEAFTTIATLERPEMLELRQCKGVTPHGLKLLSKMRNLKCLRLDSSDVTDDGIEVVSNLRVEVLFLKSCSNLTEKVLDSLGAMKSLKVLDFSNNPAISQLALNQKVVQKHKNLKLFFDEPSRYEKYHDFLN